MRLRRVLPLLLALAATAAPFGAAAGPEDEVVARVGQVAITRAELERRLAATPAVQLATFGDTPEKIRRAFLEKVVVPELLLAEGAKAQKLAEREDIRMRIQDAYRTALHNVNRKDIAEGGGVTDEDVRKYYEEHRDRFQTPERLNLWRIVVPTKADAEKLLDEVKKPGGEKAWKDLARERSTDKATHERGGNLGFVGPDGQSSEVNVKVDPALFEAAKKVQNGTFVPEPVPEGSGFAVVWRRGSTPPVNRTLEQEDRSIRQMLARQRVETRTKETLERLKKELVSDVSYELLTFVDVSTSGEVSPRKRPGVARPKALGRPQPSAGPGGLR